MEDPEIDRWARRALDGGLTLERREPDALPSPRLRWYAVHLQPTLLGGVDLVRRWGRLGTRARRPGQRVERHPDLPAATAALRRVLLRRRRRGYAPAGEGRDAGAGPPRS